MTDVLLLLAAVAAGALAAAWLAHIARRRAERRWPAPLFPWQR